MAASSRHHDADLIGRRAEVADVLGLLAPGRVLTLTGAGGAGKTRIASRVITEAAPGHPAGVWGVELADLTEPELIGDVIAAALGLRIPAGEKAGPILAAHFVAHPGLLVLDNCEHLAEPVAALVAGLLESAPGLTVLATSQLPLGTLREVLYQVPPLSVPEQGHPVGLAEAGSFDAIALYTRRATEAMAAFRLDEDNVQAVANLVSSLDGLPLAIELAAARVRVLAPDVLTARIEAGDGILASAARDRPARQRSVSAAVAWSYDLCTESEQQLWNRLSVFSGGFELESVETVCAGAGIEGPAVLDLLSRLVDLSVVRRVGHAGARYRMLETIRRFGADRLAVAGETGRWRQRHLDWFAALAVRLDAEWLGAGQASWLERLRPDHPNLRAALEHALASPATAVVALRMCHHLQHLWVCGGHFGEARRWIERAVAATEGASAEKVRALRLCAFFGAMQTDLGYARERVREAAALLDDADELTLAYHRFADGVVTCWETDLDRGLPMLTASEAGFRGSGDATGLAQTLFLIGLGSVFAGDMERAVAAPRACLEITDPLGDSCLGSYARFTLGLAALLSGEPETAHELAREALAGSAALGDHLAMAVQLEALAWTSAGLKDAERAALLLGGAASIWSRINMPVERTPYFRELHALGESDVRGMLEDPVFERHHARGRRMPLADVVARALSDDPGPPSAPVGPLSPRETEVAALVARGATNREIAEELFLSERTVEGHVQSMLRKLGFRTRTNIGVWFRDVSEPD